MSVPGNHHTIMIHECPNCHGEGRMYGAPSKWGDGHPTDLGPCQVCGGSGELEQEFECRTLEDLEHEAEEDTQLAEGTHYLDASGYCVPKH